MNFTFSNSNDKHTTMFREEPNLFSPSDVSLHCDDNIQTKHVSKVVLREKVILLGSENCGKSSIIRSFSLDENCSNQPYIMTTTHGHFTVCQVPIPNTNVTVDLFIYDTPGHKFFHNGTHSKGMWQNTSFIMCVFDVSSKKSLQSIPNWLNTVEEVTGENGLLDPMVTLLVGNKIDTRGLSNVCNKSQEYYKCSEAVQTSEGERVAKDYNMVYFECKSDSKLNTMLPFQYIAQASYKNYRDAIDRDK